MNKAHFGMPFNGHEKQTRGLPSKPWPPLFPKLVAAPPKSLCSVHFKHYIIATLHHKHLKSYKEYKYDVPIRPRKVLTHYTQYICHIYRLRYW